ncbi:hypothetical protein [Variovorax sp. JS1663]|uniref:hypothetical protein n=1 Tax=Variovorax sp. JS1663 TaxID=1851577 RepID=UPI000B341DAC|nr:hypothetical protein [Variovorax sp. JS1663]OUL98944.1 hypothetical protein A8M77_28825 [Variovorax sp. JS1663]
MKKLLFVLLVCLGTTPLWAQTTATTGNMDFEAERARLAEERKAVDARHAQEQAACYKKFAVQGCLEDSRRRHRTDTENIKRQEGAINDIERKRRGAAALDRLEEKKTNPRPQDTAPERERALKAQEDRERRAADHADDRERLEAEAAGKQRQFEQKQREYAEKQAKAANRRAEAPAKSQANERRLDRSEQHRIDLERRNARNTKPRAAPLPTPP